MKVLIYLRTLASDKMNDKEFLILRISSLIIIYYYEIDRDITESL